MYQPESMELTPKEQKVFDYLVLGMPQPTIARRLHLADATVKYHIKNIREKRGVFSTPELIAQHYLGADEFRIKRITA